MAFMAVEGHAAALVLNRWGHMDATETLGHIRIKNILYPTDFSRPSEEALPFALSLARRYGSTIFPVHIVSHPGVANVAPTQAVRAIAAQAVREGRDAMDRLEPEWGGIPRETLLRRGDIWQQISQLIAEKQIDLVVTGTRGRTGVSKILMGSVAERIFRQSPCPVLTVGPNVCGEAEAIADTRTILCPLDLSPESLAAVPYAVSLAAENEARLYLLRVMDSPFARSAESVLKAQLLHILPNNPGLSCAPTAYISCGVASEKIVELVEELAIDLIVLGVKASPDLAGASTHLGMATAYRVVTEALCPVLTVKDYSHRKA